MSYPLNRYVPGTYKRECDVCGWDYLRSELKERYDGAIVCSKDFELQHPREKSFRIPKERPFRGG
jgi:hypothetical protein